MQNIINEKGSRLLDLVYCQICEKESNVSEDLEGIKDEAIEVLGQFIAENMFRDACGDSCRNVRKEARKYSEKLKNVK